MEEYMLLIRGNESPANDPETLQNRMAKYNLWMNDLLAKEQYISGNPLTMGEVALWRDNNTLLSDGPFIEAKEVIGGFILVKAVHFEEAVELAKTCPLNQWHDIEVRKVSKLPEPS